MLGFERLKPKNFHRKRRGLQIFIAKNTQKFVDEQIENKFFQRKSRSVLVYKAYFGKKRFKNKSIYK
ncbi:hypothetical protein D6745_03665 [Candidatus Woesearchaeota archaeon]|nr:MAG: hypothetical protein D6745_03665 [Candidatus Woesearchaeota archaeon]